MPLVRLPAGIRSRDNDLQPVQPLVPPPFLDGSDGGSGWRRCDHQKQLHRFHLYQGASLGSWWQRGAKAQDIGPSRGGQTSKLHALTDVLGRPFAFALTPGNVSDMKAAPVLLSQLNGARYLVADKGYDANALRIALRRQGTVPVIPGRANRKRAIAYDKRRYRDRHLIENAFCRLKDFRRVATRYDKLARNFLSAVALATLIAFWV
jgi:transposase